MRYWDYYPPYVSVAEKRAKAAKKLAQFKKKNPNIAPVIVEGNTIAKTWWGKSWNTNLERYADYSNRIGRGRSYVRNGMVLDLQISAGEVKALVQGTRTKPYSVTVKIERMNKKNWENIRQACQGKFDSLPELLEGKFPKDLGEIFTAKGEGLFPTPKEIKFSCSCPDWASMCKHVAATLYGIGARLDQEALLFFTLRDVHVNELISQAVEDKTRQLLKKAGEKSARVLDEANLGNMFGIEMDESPEPRKQTPSKTSRKSVASKAAKQTKARTSKRTKPAEKAKKTKKPPAAAKAPAARNGTRSKTAVSAAERVAAIIQASPKGASIATLVKKTGFDERKIYNIIFRLKKQRRIVTPKRGIYQKA